MANTWTSDRAKAVFEKIGWPKGEHWILKLETNSQWWMHNRQDELEGTPFLYEDFAAALCRDWCLRYIMARHDRDALVLNSDERLDEALLETVEWHIARSRGESNGARSADR